MRHRSTSTSLGVGLRAVGDDAPTEVLPFNEFRRLAEVDFRHNGAFSSDVDVQFAPELDDRNDLAEERPLRLLPSASPRVRPHQSPSRDPRASPARSRPGSHRGPVPASRVSPLLVAAMSGGAAAAIAHAVLYPADQAHAAAEESPTAVAPMADGVEIVAVPGEFEVEHHEEYIRGLAYAQERSQLEARLLAPTSVAPTRGILTSGFGYRWGTLHAGLDIANAIGTPIVAAADGEVIAAGPTAGYGMWVKLRHADGTVTLYGHINSTTVSVSDWVMAGDQVATMGNRGNSTGPHLHFEVHRGGTDRIDPAGWLRQRGTDVMDVFG